MDQYATTGEAGAAIASVMTLPILYSFRRCPYAMRARLAVLVGGRRVALREVVLRDKPASLIAVSAKGTVPVLVLPDGAVIEESLDIMRWALAAPLPDDPRIAVNDCAFKHHLDGYKYADPGSAMRTQHRAAGTAILDDIDHWLAGRERDASAPLDAVDMALLPFVRQFAGVDRSYFDALPIAGVQRWLAAFCASPEFTAIMVRIPAWMPGDRLVAFPVSAPAPPSAAPSR